MELKGFEGRIMVADYPYVAGTPLVMADNRESLIEFVSKCTSGFTITAPCGCERCFATPDDIPFEDLPCQCGENYLIRYKEL